MGRAQPMDALPDFTDKAHVLDDVGAEIGIRRDELVIERWYGYYALLRRGCTIYRVTLRPPVSLTALAGTSGPLVSTRPPTAPTHDAHKLGWGPQLVVRQPVIGWGPQIVNRGGGYGPQIIHPRRTKAALPLSIPVKKRAWLVVRSMADARTIALALTRIAIRERRKILRDGIVRGVTREPINQSRSSFRRLAERTLERDGIESVLGDAPRETPSGYVYWREVGTAYFGGAPAYPWE